MKRLKRYRISKLTPKQSKELLILGFKILIVIGIVYWVVDLVVKYTR